MEGSSPLSEIPGFSSSEIKGWLESETNAILIPLHMKAQKLRDEMAKAIENLADASKMLLENSAKELYQKSPRSRARGLNKLAHLFLDRTRRIKVPDQVSYDSILEFARETQEVLAVTEIDVKNWFPRISPLFVLERREFLAVFGKAKETLKEINDLLTKEYVKVKSLEETFQLIDDLKTLEEQLANLNKQRKKSEDEKALLEKEIVETQQRMANLESEGEISQLDQIDMKIEALNMEVKHSLQHLQKPFIKLQSLKLHGEASGLTPEELNKLDVYMENPFEALATEDTGYPLLRQILQKLTPLISSGKLKLKPDKERKAKQAIDKILNTNSLESLHQDSVHAMTQKKQLSTSIKLAETKGNLSRLQENIAKQERRVENIKSEKKVVEKARNETLEKIRNHKNLIEKNISDSMGKKFTPNEI
jgi:ACT domain-containing protein